ncbi:MAG: hypothetical protein KGD58_18355 [Candidatus Lokiarchaeota archaeon]|nr:hypothetical protein [Candidatus Lokiarchaeota archaeon]
MRNINAHQVPGEIYLSKDRKQLIIPKVGEEDTLRIHYEILCDKIITYGIFINKIGLHPKSHYDISEDTFGILQFNSMFRAEFSK